MPSVYVKTLGCKVNTFDSHALENQFRAQGYDLTESAADADVTVVNTCSVTANADREARYLARRLRRESPEGLLVFTGCYAQTDSARLVAMDEIDYVVPNEAKERLVGLIDASLKRQSAAPGTPDDGPKLLGAKALVKDNRQPHFKSSVTLFDRADSAQTRAFVKIQDGCNGFCTYCLIPYARGQSRSVPPEQVVDEVARLIALGTHEIVFTGIHIGDYGRDLAEFAGEEYPVVTLLRRIFGLPGLGRVRISSLEPSELSPPLLALMKEKAPFVCDHLHLPMQSGSDRILKLMRRTYDAKTYRDAVDRFRTAFPEASIGADVIPGFPGETDEDFQATVRMVEDAGLSYLHVFPYSARPNTAAMRMPGHLHGDVVKTRAEELRVLGRRAADAYARRFVGKELAVVWEKDVDDKGRRRGMTANYLTVAAAGSAQPLAGTCTPALIKGFVEQGMLLARPLAVKSAQSVLS